MTLEKSAATLRFFSKSVTGENQKNIIDHVETTLLGLVKRVNSRSLLKELNESRVCSKYLVPATSEDELIGDEDMHESGDELNTDYRTAKTKFQSGEFECGLVQVKLII